jgi:hypothetical protein
VPLFRFAASSVRFSIYFFNNMNTSRPIFLSLHADDACTFHGFADWIIISLKTLRHYCIVLESGTARVFFKLCLSNSSHEALRFCFLNVIDMELDNHFIFSCIYSLFIF